MKTTFFLILVHAISLTLFAEEVIIRTPSGDSVTLEIDPQKSFEEVIQDIETCAASCDSTGYIVGEENATVYLASASKSYSQMIFDFVAGKDKKSETPRNFQNEVTKKEKDDIRYIITTLANGTLLGLITERPSLNRAGDRIDHVHPLRFLMTVFTDEEMKAAFHALKSNGGMLWTEFFEGLTSSLEEESKRKNMKKEFIEVFASTLNIDIKLVQGPINQKKWNDLATVLIKELPRGGNPGRYGQ